MRSRAELDAIRDSVIEYVRSHPPTEPLLTELYPEKSPPKTTACKLGHPRTAGRKCPTCASSQPSPEMIQRAIRIAQERPR